MCVYILYVYGIEEGACRGFYFTLGANLSAREARENSLRALGKLGRHQNN